MSERDEFRKQRNAAINSDAMLLSLLYDLDLLPEQVLKDGFHEAKLDSVYHHWQDQRKDRDRLHRVLNHIASHGIHTDRVDAHITMSMADQKEDLVTVLEREIQW